MYAENLTSQQLEKIEHNNTSCRQESYKRDTNNTNTETKDQHTMTLRQDVQPRRILLVEDDIDLAELLIENLKPFYPKAQIQVAYDPYEALDYMLDQQYDIMIADWNLPSMKAKKIFQVAEQNFGLDPTIDSTWDWKKTNVITFSSSDSIECRLCSTKHFNYLGHVNKRQSFDQILINLKNHINKSKVA